MPERNLAQCLCIPFMMNRVTVSQWTELYEITLDIKELNPWVYMPEDGLISIYSQSLDETCYFSFMSKNESSFAISCFIGYKGLRGFLDIIETGEEPPDELLFTQKSLVAYFGLDEQISPDDLELINNIKIPIEKDGVWLYFRSFEPGYVPWPLSQEEVIVLTELYKQLYPAVKDLIAYNMRADINSGNIISRSFNPDEKTWETTLKPFEKPERLYESIIVEDELLLARIRAKPLVDARLELDVFNVMLPVEEETLKKPFYPAMALLADSSSGAIIEFEMFTPEDEEAEHILALIFGFIEKHGRPLIIYLQSERLRVFIDRLCSDALIPIELVNFLPSINAFKLEKGISQIC